ncbi:MAG: hypothetical protein ACKPE3_04385 [Sphaerospermopsis kisseleviana]
MKKGVKQHLYQIADIAEEIVIASAIPKEEIPPHYTDYSILPGHLLRYLIEALRHLEQEENNN